MILQFKKKEIFIVEGIGNDGVDQVTQARARIIRDNLYPTLVDKEDDGIINLSENNGKVSPEFRNSLFPGRADKSDSTDSDRSIEFRHSLLNSISADDLKKYGELSKKDAAIDPEYVSKERKNLSQGLASQLPDNVWKEFDPPQFHPSVVAIREALEEKKRQEVVLRQAVDNLASGVLSTAGQLAGETKELMNTIQKNVEDTLEYIGIKDRKPLILDPEVAEEDIGIKDRKPLILDPEVAESLKLLSYPH
jgi:hypothetical protein